MTIALNIACDDKSAEVIDFGCGTGLVGVALAARGFSMVDGIDFSARMLEEAGQKGVYRRLIEGDLTSRTELAEQSYDAAIAVGCFGAGYIGPEDLDELIRPVRPGGVIVLYANAIPFVEDDYPVHFRRLEREGRWVVERTERSNYMDGRDRPGWLVVTRRCAQG